MIHPPRLQTGDRIGVVAPAGPPDQECLHQAVSFFEKMGLNVQLGKNIEKVNGYLAGTDKERTEDLHHMIINPEIKAIIFARGGYGTARIASYLDYTCIKRNPKVYWGYSDITYLHTAIRQQTGLITFHGPMLASDIAKDNFDHVSASMFEQLFRPITYTYSEQFGPLHVFAEGEATGMIVGGNLSLLVSSLGTPFEIDTTNRLILLEDIGEEPYRVDSMLNQLKLAGKLSSAAGFMLGDFADAKAKVTPSLSMNAVFQSYFSNLNKPVIAGFKMGHCLPNLAIPLGVEGYLSTGNKKLIAKPGVQ
ncbi:S66 peptidase family protein [Virgibacillus salexigens]|uniref:Putative murein peptide carboxypeptidase n=1 Tax=Virgibacillus massiliensis TaxID=1462526 RepID=A0A024Q7P1_9BACI|nr:MULTISPECIES: LD-carboxypeptidase [Virgibacillus]MYL40885.1 LD-carboxypeptidase [Virgibacillus massiliensis]CDQ38317.1 putative murein peptide carboxypeptidase [Virgibacillus massiliensis]